jgi:hypothetical protein
MDSRQGRLAVASYAFIADSAGWDVDEEMRRKISGVLDRELQAPLLGFEDWAAMERLVDTPGPDVVAAVLGRRVGLGFGIGPLAPVPALNGTLRVVRSLDGGERADVLDLGDIEQFIVSCRAPIGYSMVSAGARNSDVADFESTVAAYWLASELGLDVSERLRIILPALSASLDG